MEFAFLLAIPLGGAILLGIYGARRVAPDLNAFLSVGTLVAACTLTVRVIAEGNLLVAREQFFIDPFNVFLVTLTAFVGCTTAFFSRPYMRVELERGRLTAGRLRLYHAMYQLFTFTMLLALTTNNMGLLWVAMEAATLSTVLLVTLYRTRASLEAGWKYFILCGVGIAQALFGTILLYFAAEKVLGSEGVTALLWTHLNSVKGQLEPTVLSLAFVFLLVGYGTKMGLVPVHTWLPDAHSEAPTPVSALLSGALLAVSFYAILRFYEVTERAIGPEFPRNVLLAFGVASILLAALYLASQRDLKRLLAYSSVEHMGVLAIGMSISSPIAVVGVLLHVLAHAAAKGTAFFGAGSVVRKFGTKDMTRIRGGIGVLPWTGPMLVLAVLALSGMPPFGVFRSEFLIVSGGLADPRDAVAAVLVVGVTLGMLGLSWFTTRTMLTPSPDQPPRGETSNWIVCSMVIGLVALAVLGVHPPGQLSDLLTRAAGELGAKI